MEQSEVEILEVPDAEGETMPKAERQAEEETALLGEQGGQAEETDGLEKEKQEFLAEQEAFRQEKERFREEMKNMQAQMAYEQRRIAEAQKNLKKDELFFQQKMEILKGGFAQLAEDRKALEREQILLEARSKQQSRNCYDNDSVRLFFSGVSNPLTLKKRHRDLVKIFHPDNLCGDTKLLQQINRMYESMLEEVGWQKKA